MPPPPPPTCPARCRTLPPPTPFSCGVAPCVQGWYIRTPESGIVELTPRWAVPHPIAVRAAILLAGGAIIVGLVAVIGVIVIAAMLGIECTQWLLSVNWRATLLSLSSLPTLTALRGSPTAWGAVGPPGPPPTYHPAGAGAGVVGAGAGVVGVGAGPWEPAQGPPHPVAPPPPGPHPHGMVVDGPQLAGAPTPAPAPTAPPPEAPLGPGPAPGVVVGAVAPHVVLGDPGAGVVAVVGGHPGLGAGGPGVHPAAPGLVGPEAPVGALAPRVLVAAVTTLTAVVCWTAQKCFLHAVLWPVQLQCVGWLVDLASAPLFGVPFADRVDHLWEGACVADAAAWGVSLCVCGGCCCLGRVSVCVWRVLLPGACLCVRVAGAAAWGVCVCACVADAAAWGVSLCVCVAGANMSAHTCACKHVCMSHMHTGYRMGGWTPSLSFASCPGGGGVCDGLVCVCFGARDLQKRSSPWCCTT